MSDMLDVDPPYLDYRVRWRTGDSRPGKHAARQAGAGGNFRAYRPFRELPDVRQIDVRRSIADPAGEIIVRQMEQRSSLIVVLAADVSRSMTAAPGGSHMESVARLAQAAARSAVRAADSFGFLAFDERIIEALCLSPTRRRGAAAALPDALLGFRANGRNATGILELAARLPTRRCLVLLASDFLMPLTMLEAALSALMRHDVAPIMFRGHDEVARPSTGLLRVRDAETGATRLIFLRPKLTRRWRETADARRLALHALFENYGRTPFYTEGAINIAALSQHLLAA